MDHLHDPLFTTIKSTDLDLPEFVKTASTETPTLYAYFDGIENYFPISTPHQTHLSKVYFEKNASMIPERFRESVRAAIDDAVEIFGVEVKRTVEKTASQKDAFDRFMADLHAFENFGNDVSPMEKRAAAVNLVSRLGDFDEGVRGSIDRSEKLKRYAGRHLAPDWHNHVESRIRVCPHEKAREEYRVLLGDRERTESTDPLTIAKLLGYLDRKHDMERHYGRHICDPMYSMLSSDEPKKKMIIIMSVDGHHFGDDHFQKLKEDHLSRFSDEMRSRIMNREGLNSLPEYIKDILAGILNAL